MTDSRNSDRLSLPALTEADFFNIGARGGTTFESPFKAEIIGDIVAGKRTDWNRYVFHLTDGDVPPLDMETLRNLLGAPAGYVGYLTPSDGGLLDKPLADLERRPHEVILLDEIEPRTDLG